MGYAPIYDSPTCEMCDAPTTKVYEPSMSSTRGPQLRVSLCDHCWDELDPPRRISGGPAGQTTAPAKPQTPKLRKTG